MVQTQTSQVHQRWFSKKEDQRIRINRLKESIDAEQLLELLGFSISKSTSTEVRAICKLHGGTNKSSFRMNKQTKNWVCFSQSCQETIGYDVISLVKSVLNLSFPDALKYLESISGVNIHDEAAYVQYKRDKDRREFIQQSLDNRQVPTSLVTEEYLNSFKKFRSNFFEKEKNGSFTKEILDKFEVGGGYVDKYGFQRDVIPIRDVNGELKAYSCRDITGKADESFKYLLTKKFDKNKVLYNLQRAKKYMGKSRSLIVVEGFKSVWKLYMAGYKNVVACIGSSITPGQQSLLYSYAFEVILFLDGDAAGVKGTSKALEDMKGKIKIIPIFFPYDKIDPGDLNVEQFEEFENIFRRV
jgi:DNA primase